jgi:hypothetical protein
MLREGSMPDVFELAEGPPPLGIASITIRSYGERGSLPDGVAVTFVDSRGKRCSHWIRADRVRSLWAELMTELATPIPEE